MLNTESFFTLPTVPKYSYAAPASKTLALHSDSYRASLMSLRYMNFYVCYCILHVIERNIVFPPSIGKLYIFCSCFLRSRSFYIFVTK